MRPTVNPLLITAYFLLFYLQLSSLELVCQQNEEVIKKREVAIKELQSELDRQAQIAAMIHNLSSGKVPITNFAGKSSWPWFNMLSVSFFLSPLLPLSTFSLFCFFSSSSPLSWLPSSSAWSSSPLPSHHHHWHYPAKEVSDKCPLQIFSFIVPFCRQNYLSMLRFLSVLLINRSKTELFCHLLRTLFYQTFSIFLLIWLQIFHRKLWSVFWKDWLNPFYYKTEFADSLMFFGVQASNDPQRFITDICGSVLRSEMKRF